MSESLNADEYAIVVSEQERLLQRFQPLFDDMAAKGARPASIEIAREGVLRAARMQGDQEAASAFVDGLPYEPFVEAFVPEERHDLPKSLKAAIESEKPPTLTVQYPARDGEFETLHFNALEARQYIEGDPTRQTDMRARKTREARLQTAIAAADKLRESGHGALSPRESFCLWQFGGLMQHEGEGMPSALREGFVGRAREALASNTRDLEPQRLREFWGWSDGTETEPRATIDGLPYGGGGRLRTRQQYGPNELQMTLSDVWQEQAQVRQTWIRDPICKAAIHVSTDFVFGRGFSVVADDPKLQAVFDEYDSRHTMQTKKNWLRSTKIMGEIFLAHTPIGDGKIKTTQLHQQTIWYVVTLATDITVPLFYVQRYLTQWQQFADPANPQQYIDRIWPAEAVDHFKINAELDEVRGRSEIYAALPYHLMYRDLWEAYVTKDQAAAAYSFVGMVEGGQADVNAVQAKMPKGRPRPGSSFWFGSKVKSFDVLTADKTQPSGTGSTNEGLLNIISVNYGFAKEYLGVSGNRSRGGAVTAVGPAEKAFENQQDDFTELFKSIYDRVLAEAQKNGLLNGAEKLTYKIIWPDIVKADSQTKVTLLVVGRAQGFISHQSGAQLWASAIDYGDYNYEDELAKIAAEKAAGIGLPQMPPKFDSIDPPTPPSNQDPNGDPAGGDPRAADVIDAIRNDDMHAASEAMAAFLTDRGAIVVRTRG